MVFDIAAVPFSRYGSYLAFAQLPAQANRRAGVYLRTLHGAALQREILRCELSDSAGPAAAVSVCATPSCLQLQSAASRVEICFSDARSVRIRGEGLGLSLVFAPQLYDLALPRGLHWQLNLFSCRINLALTALAGTIGVDAPCTEQGAEHLLVQCRPDASGCFEISLCEFQSSWPSAEKLRPGDFRSCERAVAAEFQQWLQRTPAVSAQYERARELAAYVQWSSVVDACGQLQRPALLMSKNWLHAVWSWDHCFNAMALLAGNPALAWDQFMLPFDRQDRHGALPDCFDDERSVWNFCKPPIHGWALTWMLRRTSFIGQNRLREIYTPLSRWTAWWSEQRDDNGDGLPQYNHGNDSGWDNATPFALGVPLKSPDLAALLCLQMQCLAEIAQRLDKQRDAQQWQRRADVLLQKLIECYWRGDRFTAIGPNNGRALAGDSLLLFLPIVLGRQLPTEIATALVAGLRDEQRFLAPFGLASESIASPLYRADSYWRGPTWAPATLLIVEGLTELGEHLLARTIAQRFCAAVQSSGCAENFDVFSGRGLRDPAHTWTASIFLILARDYLGGETSADSID